MWQNQFTASSLKDILESVDGQNITDFVKMLVFIVSCSIFYPYFTVAK